MGEQQGLLTTGEVATRLSVSRMTVTRLAESGHLVSIKLPSGRRRFDPADVTRFIEERREAGDAA